MARKTRSHRRRIRFGRARRATSGKNIPLAPVLGVAAGIGITALGAWNMGSGKPMAERAQIVLDQIGQSIYGYSAVNQKWYTGNMPRFWAPVAGGTIAHIVANKIGLNPVLRRFKLGFTI